MTEKHRQAIEARNALLKKAETDLREHLKKLHTQLATANRRVFENGEDADQNSQSQLFQLLQDRLSETAFPNTGVYRY